MEYVVFLVMTLIAVLVFMTWQPPVTETMAVPWKRATLTVYESYPTTAEECDKYSGCQWMGRFAAQAQQRPKQWVAARNIVAVHSANFNTWRNRWIRIRYMNRFIDCKVIDMCKDSDTESGQECTVNKNINDNGFLLDIETHTAQRLGFTAGMDNCRFTLIAPNQVKYLYGAVPPHLFDTDRRASV